MINLLRRSRIDPTKSAYEVLEGPYDWNRYPLAPLGTKAVIYEAADTRASWALHGLDAWLLEPSKDHYCCNLYYFPKTKGYQVSGSADLFPQHCIAPTYTPVTHVVELSTELQDTLTTLPRTACTSAVVTTLARHIDAYVLGTVPPSSREEQRVDMVSPPPAIHQGIQRVTDTCHTPLANNPTSTRVLQTAPQTHLREMRANIPGALPKITRATIIAPLPLTPSPIPTAKRVRIAEKRATQSITTKSTTTPLWSNRLALPQLRNPRIVSREALAHLLIHESTANMLPFTPTKLCRDVAPP